MKRDRKFKSKIIRDGLTKGIIFEWKIEKSEQEVYLMEKTEDFRTVSTKTLCQNCHSCLLESARRVVNWNRVGNKRSQRR